MNNNYFKEIEDVIKRNLAQRGMDKINLVGELEKASRSLLTSKTILIVTGFVVKDKLIGETDGPIGAISLASSLEKLGKKVILITDKYSEDMLYNCRITKGIKAPIEIIPYKESKGFCENLLQKYKPTHVIAIERPGRAKDGRCYSMRGEDLSDMVPDTDILFKRAKELGFVTIAIGDGGNEIGMGKVSSFVRDSVDKGEKICAVTSTDYLIVAGVSNWGGHGLSAALSIMTNSMLLHDKKTETQILKCMVESGAVDGCSKANTMTVDGLSLYENLDVVKKLRSIVELELNIIEENKIHIM